jgi:hypothetical protein
MSDQHVLVVGEFNPADPTDCLDIEHRDDCPTTDVYIGEQSYSRYVCDVGEWMDAWGLDEFFRHAADPAGDGGLQVLTPGPHLIEAWTEEKRNHQGIYEVDGGLRVASESEVGAA